MNIGHEVARLQRMTVKQLRERYAEVFGDETRTGNKAWLVKRIAWRVQFLAEGGLSQRAQERARQLASEADIRMMPPKLRSRPGTSGSRTVEVSFRAESGRRVPVAGSLLTREYKGQTIRVHVLENGFEYEGAIYRSLSAVAKHITGSHVSGHRFFQLSKGQ